MSYSPSKEVKAFRKIGKIPCVQCSGSGLVDLPGHLREIWAYLSLKDNRSGLTADELCAMVGDSPTHVAMNSRLECLMSIGLIIRFKMGRAYVWKVWE